MSNGCKQKTTPLSDPQCSNAFTVLAEIAGQIQEKGNLNTEEWPKLGDTRGGGDPPIIHG